ncbi:MAG: DUF1631 domain-containing protein, partial [Ramlibacter sp.]|nr:DUF1631 domain-containing protein [Ramlibacter sp.]
MSASQLPQGSGARLARQAREQFVARAEALLRPLVQAIRGRLSELANGVSSSREMHERRDAMLDFERKGAAWAQATARAWRQALATPVPAARHRPDAGGLELIGDDVVERKILSSRLALSIQEKATWDLNDLRLRMQFLEGGNELAATDVLRPEAFAQIMVDQWDGAELSPQTWALVSDLIQQHVLQHVPAAYHAVNEFLVAQGVMRDIDLSSRVKRAASAGGAAGPGARGAETGPAAAPLAGGVQGGGAPGATFQGAAHGGHAGQSRPGAATQPGAPGAPDSSPGAPRAGGVADETRLMTSSPPLARARMRATGVLAQLKRLLSDRVAGFDSQPATRPSPALAEALSQQATQAQGPGRPGTTQGDFVFDAASVQDVAVDLRRQTSELKRKAATSSEKATIEIVALMFQSILSEERIPPAVRVWFARLQMPVLRVAIAEPEFFGSLEHPARQLIDRMGSCVMGFDAAAIGGTALEAEIKRVVQVIEQYPETGRRVFQLVYEEFQRFLSRFLTETAPTQRLVSVAQQVEQKETLAIQYTIELRSMLSDMPVRDEIREFLFKVWAEVLALSAVKNGPQHEETLALKGSASELVWAASAKPNRNERARVIQDLPRLLQRLRQGMTLAGIQGAAQEAHIKAIGDTLADAFLSKT